jgi:hypothetical protein
MQGNQSFQKTIKPSRHIAQESHKKPYKQFSEQGSRNEWARQEKRYTGRLINSKGRD